MNNLENLYWEKNIAVLKANYPGLAEQIAAARREDDEPSLSLEKSASGLPALKVNGVHIHSNRDPVREGRRQVEAVLGAAGKGKESTAPLVLLGFGLGYAAEAAAALFPKSPLVIAERRPEIFRLALESRDLEAFLSTGKHIFIVGGEPGGLTGALSFLEQAGGEKRERPLLIKNRALAGAVPSDGEWYADAESRIMAWAAKDEVNAATLRKFGGRWTKNLAANLGAIRDIPGVAFLSGCLGGNIPVFLAAAGPGLDECAPFIPAIRERCLVVAVDTSLRFILASGAVPDFTVAVDPQFWNARHLHHLGSPGGRSRQHCLVAESSVYPSVIRDWTGTLFNRILLCGSLFPLGRFIEEKTGYKGRLGAGGSVATTAWDFARLLSPASIWIAGLDLAFPGFKTHFKGAAFEESAHAESTRLFPAETRSVLALESGYPFYAKSVSGGRVLTGKQLSLYGLWFENRAGQEKTLKNFNLSSSGLAIRGMIPAALETLLALPPRRKEIDSIVGEVFTKIDAEFNAPEEKSARGTRYKEALAALSRGLLDIRDEAARAEKLAAGFRGGGPERENLLKKLEGINRNITKSPVKEAAGFLFPPSSELEKQLEEGAVESAPDPWRRHLRFSVLFYRELGEAAEKTALALKKQNPEI